MSEQPQETEPFAMVTLAAGIGGFLLLPIVFVPLGLVAGIVSAQRFKENKNRKGNELRIAGGVLNLINMLWLSYQYRWGIFSGME